MKKMISLCFAVLLLLIMSVPAFASDAPLLSVVIDSPTSVKGIPGLDSTVSATVTNNSDKPIDDVMVYITMADLDKHMTVNLEDYSANKPQVVGTLQAHESKAVQLPIRFVYVDKFWLYTTAVTSTSNLVASSGAISVEILGNTLVDRQMVQAISIAVPAVLIIVTGFILVLYKKRQTVE